MIKIMTMLICIKDLSFEAIIGILPEEMEKAQKIKLSAKIKYNYADPSIYIDYVKITNIIMSCVKTKHYGLLEEALKDIAITCFKYFKEIKTISLYIEKLDILKNCRVGIKSKFTRHSFVLHNLIE